MKLTNRGFTLVELMIVIAIIGVLAAALFPSMTGYLKRSRDAARTSNIKDITTALGAFYADSERYPYANSAATGHCFAESAFMSGGTGHANYFPKGFPADPQASSRSNGVNGCGIDKTYGYNTGTVSGIAGFQVVGYFENTTGGNTGSTATGALSLGSYNANLGIVKGAGATYLLGN